MALIPPNTSNYEMIMTLVDGLEDDLYEALIFLYDIYNGCMITTEGYENLEAILIKHSMITGGANE